MKKYISLLSIATAFLMQSCERSDSDVNSDANANTHITEPKNQNIKILSHQKSVKTANNNSTAKNETDTKDEPKRDKQHWRSIKDTIL